MAEYQNEYQKEYGNMKNPSVVDGFTWINWGPKMLRASEKHNSGSQGSCGERPPVGKCGGKVRHVGARWLATVRYATHTIPADVLHKTKAKTDCMDSLGRAARIQEAGQEMRMAESHLEVQRSPGIQQASLVAVQWA